jgi:3-isopropylmalate dehydrogenase
VKSKKKLLILPGDGVGPEVCNEARKVIDSLSNLSFELDIDIDLIGGASIDKLKTPLSSKVLDKARNADSILLGAVGGKKWDSLSPSERPEKGLLELRSKLNSSSLKESKINELDILIVRELTSGIYFGEPRKKDNDYAFNTMSYKAEEIERIVDVAFKSALERDKRLCSVDKANVLEVSQLWREIVDKKSSDYPDVKVEHMLVDNAAMQLVREPKQFDVIVSSNLFGDILSDISAMLTGSIGMLPSASLNESLKGLYEPVHGSAPDIAGKGVVNPIATILSVAMLMKYSFNEPTIFNKINDAVRKVLSEGYATEDIAQKDSKVISTSEMGDRIASYV